MFNGNQHIDNTILNLDFDEKQFDLDDYEKRLKNFEEYLNSRDLKK